MKAICLYFQVHQPFRLKTYRFFDIGKDDNYFDNHSNAGIIRKIAEKCYLPANKILMDIIRAYPGRFKVAFSISGTALDQFELYAPEVLKSFRELVATGHVELLAETYSHSLASLVSGDEFKKQVKRHIKRIRQLFGVTPTTFRNTELIYSDKIARKVAMMGFEAMLTEGTEKILGPQSPNHIYKSQAAPNLKLLLKNYRLSDDIAFRFSDQSWQQWPLTSQKFIKWLNELPEEQQIVNLFMDYETFGEHQWAANGIFDFLTSLSLELLTSSPFTFVTPTEAIRQLDVRNSLSASNPISWADEARDLSAWLGNELQHDAFDSLYKLKKKVKKCTDKKILNDWKYLQTSDHFYYMCTKDMADGEVHKYFTPYSSPYLAFINYMNVLSDFEIRVTQHLRALRRQREQQLIKKLINDEREAILQPVMADLIVERKIKARK
ncbi:Alpha-amylase [Fulvivirga imtechensis AK7]|uniref:Alpha-amylase n=1 Tax=Fulvivirga imtechensis AK7 TaxID=1237149 RepID=L8JPC5_9BACT|nr:glycoside hydrolase family 57 protein [Fulvivirga imtechensis]ELR70786.1 Alpha-amylase [Fulvivirga imtechensis AK7]